MSILYAKPTNLAVDCYSLGPVSKFKILEALQSSFGLRYELLSGDAANSPTGHKPFYYSLNKKAAQFGYSPAISSLDTVISQIDILMRDRNIPLSNSLNGDFS